jgi:tRNA dimethylallyltransferase
MLKKVDSKRAQVLSSPSERHNKVRLIRALEIARALGKTPKTTSRAPYDVFWVGIKPKDGVLRDRIDMRLTWHLKKGMIAEASRLHRTGLTYKRMEELGLEYRSLARFLQKKITRAELENELQSDIWRYARKQLGYWKRNGKIVWFAPSERAAILRRTRTWLMKNF